MGQADILKLLIRKNKKMSIDEIAKYITISRSNITNGLLRLYRHNDVNREMVLRRETNYDMKRAGTPMFRYWANAENTLKVK